MLLDSTQTLKTSAALLAAITTLTLYTHNVTAAPAFGQLADQSFHLEFAKDFAQSWADGDFPPTWAANASGGRGSMGFTVYPPLFAFVCTFFIRTGFPPTEALRLAFLTAALGSFAAIFYLAKAFLSTRRSLIAASTVLLLPGATFIALGRGMFPNFAAIGWAALLLGAAQRALKSHRTVLNAALMTVAAAGMILTHTLSAYLLALLLIVILPLIIKALNAKQLTTAAAAALAAALLTCWYWIPSMHASTYCNSNYLTQSHPYFESTFFASFNTKRSFQQDWAFLNDLGKYIILVQSLMAFLIAPALLDCKKILFLKALPWVAGFALLAATAPIAIILQRLPSFVLIQFAWRWQLLIALWCGVGLASLPLQKGSIPAAIAGLFTLLFFSPMLPPSKTKLAEQRQDLAQTITQEEFEALRPIDRAAYANNLLELRPNQIDTHYYLPVPFGRTSIIEGTASIEPRLLNSSRREYTVDATTGATIRIETYAAPGWSAQLDNDPIDIHTEKETGLQVIELSKGTHHLVMKYQAPWR